jgi:Cu/Zn superoxide dismutase
VPQSPRTLGLCLAIVGFASCSGRVELPDGGVAGADPSGLGGSSSNGGIGGKLGSAGRAAEGGGGAGGGGSGGVSPGGVSAVGGSQDGGAGGDAAGGAPETLEAEAPLMPTAGNSVTGSVHFKQQGTSVAMNITLATCPEGPHALHLHANPACGDNANAAGGHWSPQGEGIADIKCGPNGAGKLSLQAAPGVWSIGGPAVSDLLRHAIILHGATDQPDAAARIACGIPAKVP